VPTPEPCSELITPEVVAFVHGGVVALVGTAAADLTPALTRGFAPRIAPDRRTVEVFVGRAQSAACLANLTPGAAITVIIGNPVDYRGLQIKGATTGRRDAGSGDADWLRRQQGLYADSLERIGMARAHAARLWSGDLVCVTFVPTAIFRQTPGPGAGDPLAAGPAWT
jgi:hypothetical protein